ncbi:MAG: helix-turn-helix transcriptional regulator [Treponema sp.]|nr:helix-turn-helix transcriptional regulator [Treponema sp.]
MEILEKIRNLRLERNWSEYQLAEKSGLPQSTISSWYRKDMLPSISSLEKICEAFNITLAQFFTSNSTIELTEKQNALLSEFNRLSQNQQDGLLQFLQTL